VCSSNNVESGADSERHVCDICLTPPDFIAVRRKRSRRIVSGRVARLSRNELRRMIALACLARLRLHINEECPMNIEPGSISHVIQVSVAPVFLLTGVATKLSVLTNRLGRIIDRTRRLGSKSITQADFDELDVLFRRSHLINRAITASTICGFLVCLTIVMLFAGDTTKLHLDSYIAGSFVITMFSLIFSFGCLLREIFIAAAHTRQRHDAIVVTDLQAPSQVGRQSATAGAV
jgi:Ni/Fe-hydrogenase subunit HybB-like protein